jgi:acetyl esterase/lipase
VACLPLSVLRRPPGSFDKVLSSKRYAAFTHNIIEPLERSDFSALWIYGPKLDASRNASAADVVIMFAHGGGYVVGRPHTYVPMLLRVAEGIEATGRTVAICALDYSLAPEHLFPRQLIQMTACWEYLAGELGIPTSKLALMGDSAGGSLCLSFLSHMADPVPGVKAVRDAGRPGMGLYLISPWVSIQTETGYVEKKDLDILDIRVLAQWASMFTHGVQEPLVQKYLEFACDRNDFAAILPEYVWVSAGSDEIFIVNITKFVQVARQSGKHVTFEVKNEGIHDWQLAESQDHEAEFLRRECGELGNDIMSGAAALSEAVVYGFTWKTDNSSKFK